MLKQSHFTILICLIFSSFYSFGQEKPNIVVIMADDLGYSDLGCYGGEIETPVLDGLAANGLRFTQFYNCGRCWPTRGSILSGYYPQQINLDGKRADFPKWGHLIPHHLKQAGYRSYHTGKWHVMNVDSIISEGGFDKSYHLNSYDNHFSAKEHFLNEEKLPEIDDDPYFYSTEVITNYGIRFLKEHQEESPDSAFFLYVAYITPHFPLQAPQEEIDKYRKRYLNGWNELRDERYKRQQELGLQLGENSPFEYFVTAPWSWPEKWLKDSIPGELRTAKPWEQLDSTEKDLHATKMAIHAAMVSRIDEEIGRIVRQLEVMGEKDNTLILFLSDNGASAEQIIRGQGHDHSQPMGCEGTYLCLGPGFSTASNTPFRRHKFWTHEGGIATPMIAHWPDSIKDAGALRYSMGHVVDFLPTFLDLAGVDPIMEKDSIKAPPLPGRSLIPSFLSDDQPERELYFSHGGNHALRDGKWKAVISTDIDGRWQLYDMEEDRTELNNLADKFYRFGDDEWKQSMANRLEEMKTRWEELDQLYQEQGK